MSDENKALVNKAMLVLSDLDANGGRLNAEQNDRFIRKVMDEPTMLKAVREVKMTGPEAKVNSLGFGDRIMRAANQTAGSRALAEADRSKPTTSQVTLETKEVIAEIALPYEVLEDNIEKGALENTILDMIAQRASLDLEELLLLGDTGNTDPYLGLMDGVLKRCDQNVADAATVAADINTFNNLMQLVPARYRRNIPAMRFFATPDVEQNYRVQLSSRGSALGDDLLTSRTSVPILGVPMQKVALMPSTNLLFTDPLNILFGVQRDIRIESERNIKARQIDIVVTARVAVQVENTEAMSKVINLG